MYNFTETFGTVSSYLKIIHFDSYLLGYSPLIHCCHFLLFRLNSLRGSCLQGNIGELNRPGGVGRGAQPPTF